MADDSGVNVYPRLPMPKANRESDPALKRKGGGGGGGKGKLLVVAGLALLGGVAIGAIVRPLIAPDSRLDTLAAQVASEQRATKVQADKAAFLDKQVVTLTAASDALTKRLTVAEAAKSTLEGKAADLDKKAQEIAAVEAKLRAAVDKSSGSVTSEGDEVRLQLVDKVLFKLNDDQLTDKGKLLVDKLAGALKELPDKQVWVQGHTDDQPIFNVPLPKPAPLKKGPKAAAGCPIPPPKFATNWELSSARALTVVHYLQDVSKIEPGRLAALAFGQYRPVSKVNKAANRRIEIVLYPKHQIAIPR
ncbi:MAG: OmpA family protein [Proteobacteria bacterium]|nr:OmpA family protein [Pseudomonadota bacterium]